MRSLLHSGTVSARPRTAGSTTDIDGFIATHEQTWDRLAVLVRQAGSDPRRLTSAELDELLRLHLRVSSHLSTARTRYAHADLLSHLSELVARSSAVVHGSRPRTWSTAVRGVREVFPAAVWHTRTAVAVAAAVFAVVAGAMGIWLATSQAAYEAALPAEVREAYLERDFEAYYASEPGTTFAARVFTNNAQVGAMAFASGIAFAVPTLLILALNAANVGVAAGLFHAAGDAARFWGLILPHGLLELTAVFVAAGAGLQLGWAVIAPGDRTRREALSDEGRRAVVIVIGLVVVFAVAAVLEAFVTPSPWPAWARVGTGALACVGFLAYVAVLGRRAGARGLTGALRENGATDAGYRPPVALTSR